MKFKRIFPGWLSKFMMAMCVLVAVSFMIEDYKNNMDDFSRIFICCLCFLVFYSDYNVVKYNDDNEQQT